jgi:hypothetical protein
MFEVFTTVIMSTCLCDVTDCSLLGSFLNKPSKQRVVLLEGPRVAGSAFLLTVRKHLQEYMAPHARRLRIISLQHVAQPTFEPETSRI